MPRWLSHNRGFPFRLNRWIIDAFLNSWGMASFLHIMWNKCHLLCNWSSSCFVDLSRNSIWSRSLARWQKFLHILSLQRTGVHQPYCSARNLAYIWTVLHIFEYAASLIRTVLVSLRYALCFSRFSSRSPWISSSFSSNQSWCLRDTGPREAIAEEWTASLKTVQFSSRSSEVSSIASNRLQILLMKACLLLSCFSLETSSLFGTVLPCGRRAGWIRRLSLLKTSLWSVQQSAPHIVFVTLICHIFIIRKNKTQQRGGDNDLAPRL